MLVVMGVAGSGKSTVARVLADRLGWPFQEGDDLHPQANVEKMRAGHPLTDADRRDWLARVAAWVDERLDRGESGVITCSALKRSYRDLIGRGRSDVVFVFLSGSRDLIAKRLGARHGHFMPSSLLDSQFADLEEPAPDETAIQVDLSVAPRQMARRVAEKLGLA